ncbi:hypothetical protein [Nocardioides soli]|uniref:Uncharacterized protein n=1 Tax=Nocardioides soli TaxID=1036020 RepID=A0A7W4Z0W2_9ACTN|nr:hypothetical protein [Nocardioides soli]MBB3041206.1 hypothetical protein [Nocardioides soli]
MSVNVIPCVVKDCPNETAGFEAGGRFLDHAGTRWLCAEHKDTPPSER